MTNPHPPAADRSNPERRVIITPASEDAEAQAQPPEQMGLEGATKSPEAILQEQITEEEKQFEQHPRGVFLSAISAGLDIGFGPFLMAVVLTLAGGVLSVPVTEILIANTYSLGFVFVVMGGSALFTEHTALAVLPVLDGSASLRQLAHLWGLIYGGNMVGAAAFAALAALIGPALGVIDPAAFGEIARRVVHHSWWVTLLSGVLAGWMMGLLAWLVTSGRDTISQLFFVWLVTTGIGLAHLHHSIAGTVEVLAGVFSGQGAGMLDFAGFLLWATIGNAVGGVVFVGLIKYGYVTQGVPRPDRMGLRQYPAEPRRPRRSVP